MRHVAGIVPRRAHAFPVSLRAVKVIPPTVACAATGRCGGMRQSAGSKSPHQPPRRRAKRPPTERDRPQLENPHPIHPARLKPWAPRILRYTNLAILLSRHIRVRRPVLPASDIPRIISSLRPIHPAPPKPCAPCVLRYTYPAPAYAPMPQCPGVAGGAAGETVGKAVGETAISLPICRDGGVPPSGAIGAVVRNRTSVLPHLPVGRQGRRRMTAPRHLCTYRLPAAQPGERGILSSSSAAAR